MEASELVFHRADDQGADETLYGFADLHTHSTASDGTNAPADNVRLAKESGLSGISVTDHDTVAGVTEALEEGMRIGITVIPGVEISTVAQGRDIHILGYYMNIDDEKFLQRLSDLRRTRNLRNELMIEKLNQLGVMIRLEEVMARLTKAKADETVGRPHIAQVLIDKGYVATMEEAFDRYLGSQGLAYANPPRITPYEAIQWIREAGGRAVLAHPGLYNQDDLVTAIIKSGVDGLEVYHSDHSIQNEEKYAELAKAYQLIVTGGSDYHGERNGIVFHGALGSKRVPMSVVQQLKPPVSP
ncbi:metal-dependent phosphoesterase [Paenibacillus swuensis]|uniref:Metal-dependent phosphoesterase n=2 Tax=Paenibacillus swuensis TaxID=1178515 RepID=A0A172TK77_9BACL|nr:metal-dependent phosphoesterase [Paenibacillus swuensis]